MLKTEEFAHRDALDELNEKVSLKEKLTQAHGLIKEKHPFIVRIALALYDTETKVLKNYIHSSGGDNPLEHYQTPLENAPSLREILERGRPRVVNNLVTFEDGEHEHTRRIGRHGYAASYTMPMFSNGEFMGFIFFNSFKKDVFTEKVLRDIDVYGHLVSLIVINELSGISTLSAAIKSTGHMAHMRDTETGSHLDRMSRYSRVIANALADQYELDDTYIEYVFMFSPLHDIGKIAIPDSILLKPSGLTDKEMKVMQSHTLKGRQIIDEIIANFRFDNISNIDILKNIAEYHHESMNGSGYPEGRSGDDIPLEARIVAVADIFDALTSKRPYKEAWSVDKAIDTLKNLAGEKLDQKCVKALIDNREEIEEIRRQFKEDIYG